MERLKQPIPENQYIPHTISEPTVFVHANGKVKEISAEGQEPDEAWVVAFRKNNETA